MTPLATPIFDFHHDGSALTTPTPTTTPTPSLVKTSLKNVHFSQSCLLYRSHFSKFLCLFVLMNSTPFVIIIIPFSPRGRGGGGGETGRSLASSIAFQLTFFVTDSFRSNWPIRCKICGTQACQGLGLRSRLCLVQFWI